MLVLFVYFFLISFYEDNIFFTTLEIDREIKNKIFVIFCLCNCWLWMIQYGMVSCCLSRLPVLVVQ